MPQNNFLAYARKKTKTFGSSMKRFGTGVKKDLEGGMNKMKKKMGMSKRKASPKKRTMRKTATRNTGMRTVKVRGKGKADMYAKGLRKNKVEFKRMKTGANSYEFRMKSSTRKASPKKRTMSDKGSSRKTYTASELKKGGLKQMSHKGKKYYVKSAKQTDTNRKVYTRASDKKRDALPAGRRYVYVPELRRYVSYTETRVDRSDKRRGRV